MIVQTRGEVEKRFEVAKKRVIEQRERITKIISSQLKKQTKSSRKSGTGKSRRAKSETNSHTNA